MPPRIPSHRLPQRTCNQCFRTRPTERPGTLASPRQFHTTPSTRTRLRRNMFAWLKGPGKAFRDPLPNSTNYLNAYDKEGNLLRSRNSDRDPTLRALSDPELNEPESALQDRDRAQGVAEEEVLKRAERRAKLRVEKKEMEERGGVPRESGRDLRPYPLNREFRSQSVLSEELRGKIFEMVGEGGHDFKAVSAAFGVDVRRVAAVVRLGSLEREWVKEGKKLAKPYNAAILSMLPQTPYRPTLPNPPAHESINDLPVHPSTRPQIFLPTSESRPFTRADAAKTFHPNLLPADDRIPHPELVQITKWEMQGHDRETRQKMMREKDAEVAFERAEKERKRKRWEERTQVVVEGRRWDFRFQDVSAEKVGKDGRGREAVGLRYGFPHEDRKRGQVKIPTKVE